MGQLIAIALITVCLTISCSNEEAVEPELARLVGIVTDADTQRPLPKVEIVVGVDSTETGGDGDYSVSGLSSGSYTITATKDNYEAYSAQIDVSGIIVHNIELQLEAAP
jgi:hypothetical protein